MGNELISGGNINNESILGQYVKDFMLNKYEYKPGNNFKNFLKKRACCKNTVDAPIALPSYNTLDKKLYPTKINIKIFDDVKDITDNACTFENKNKYRPEDSSRSVNWVGGNTCNTFYTEYCDAVYEDRKSYDNDYFQLYGPYKDNPKTSQPDLAKLFVGNQYSDCNCMNSIHVRKAEKVSTNIMKPSNATMAQMFDERCANFIPFGAYITEWAKQPGLTLCVNSINVGGPISATEKSAIGLSQNCNASSTNAASTAPPPPPPPPPTPTPTPTPTTPTTTTTTSPLA